MKHRARKEEREITDGRFLARKLLLRANEKGFSWRETKTDVRHKEREKGKRRIEHEGKIIKEQKDKSTRKDKETEKEDVGRKEERERKKNDR